MTTLAAIPVTPGQLDLLTCIADTSSPLGSLRYADFRSAYEWDGFKHGGEVDPNRVAALLHRRHRDVKPRTYSAWWAPACGKGPNAFMDKTDIEVPIDPTYSKGNGNKKIALRKLRVAS